MISAIRRWMVFLVVCVCMVTKAACLNPMADPSPAEPMADPNAQSALWMALIDTMAGKALQRPVLGISIAVANSDRIVFARGYGFADVGRTVPVRPETVFHVASISKNIAAGVLLQLAEQGQLKLDDEVTRYVPDAPVRGKHVTVLELLNHTSGIHSFTSLPEAARNEALDLSHQQVLGLIKDAPPDFDPGASWRYNNSGFYLAGMVAENVAHLPYATLLRDRIFNPIQMQSSSLCDGSAAVAGLASGSEVLDGKLVASPPMSWKLPFAAGAVCSTASDLLKWQIALNKGRVVSKHWLTMMRTPTLLADGTSIDYGLGTSIGLLDGHHAFGHTGSGGGFTTILETFPDEHLSIAVLINTASEGAATWIAGELARGILGLIRFPLRDSEIPESEATCIPALFDSDQGRVQFSVQGGKLHYEIPGVPGAEGTGRRQGENSYAIDENRRIRFQCAAGKSRWALVYSAGLMIDAKRAQEKQ